MAEKKEALKVVFGCYGGRRGATVHSLVKAKLAEELGPRFEQQVQIYGVGNREFIGNKENHPISEEHRSALEQAAKQAGVSYVHNAVDELGKYGRRVADANILKGADAVYVADKFIQARYQEQAGEPGSEKYHTMLEAAELQHPNHGADLDDTETPVDFVTRVVVPKKTNQKPNPRTYHGNPTFNPAHYEYYDLGGAKHQAGSEQARLAEARDLIIVADRIATRILTQVHERAGRVADIPRARRRVSS